MALLFKKLTIDPQGNIVGGYLQYSMDPDQGSISYQGEVTASAWFIKKTVPLNGISKVDPAILQSRNVKVGEAFDFGNLKIMVTDITEKTATAHVVLAGDVSGSGTAKFDLSDTAISLDELTLTASVPIIGNQTLHAEVV